MHRIVVPLLLILIMPGCFLFEQEGKLILQKGKYTIRQKPLVSYYKASPDLFVATEKGTVKINLNGFGKIIIPQEKITSASIREIGKDTIEIYFSSTDTTQQNQELIIVPVTYAVDSILRNNNQ